MRQILRSRAFRFGTICYLLLLQLNVLWAAESHEHNAERLEKPHCVCLHRCTHRNAADTGREASCLTCQIVRNSASRPATRAQAPTVTQTAQYRPRRVFDGLLSPLKTTADGRAPPR